MIHYQPNLLSVDAPPSTSVIERLEYWAAHHPDRTAYSFLSDDDEVIRISYAELTRTAGHIAGQIREHADQYDRALLLYPAGLDFIAAFFGCQYAGVTAVPTCYPKPKRPMPRLSAIAENADASIVLTTGQTLNQLELAESDTILRDLPWIATDDAPDAQHSTWNQEELRPDDLAFLQFTSGSTSQPRGVMVSHHNLMSNLEAIRRGFQIKYCFDLCDTGVFWLPAYHDMGLIGGLLTPLYVGGHSILMSPRSFLQRPLRWLRAIADNAAKISGAPNFAYDFCVDKISEEEAASLDLSSWELAFCGAEPIRPKTLKRFAQHFAVSGFRNSSFYPCYGLAETTLLAAGGAGPTEPKVERVLSEPLQRHQAIQANGSPASQVQELVVCGRASHGHEVLIVNPESCAELPAGDVGEIWVSGPSVALGYWNQPAETAASFQAQLAGDSTRKFVRTGDLGFFTPAGELCITGRLKDVIILRGRNLYPQDIELTVAQAHESLRLNGGAAFSVDHSGQERLAVVHEVDRQFRNQDWEEVVKRIRAALASEHEIDPHTIVLLRQASLPLTTSGKVQRQLCRERLLNNELKTVHQWTNSARPANGAAKKIDAAPALPARSSAETVEMTADEIDRLAERIEIWLTDWLEQKAGVATDEITRDKPFAEYGLDSLTAVEMSQELEDWLHIKLNPVVAWNYPTPAKMAPYLARLVAGLEELDEVAPEAVPVGNEESFEDLLGDIESLSEEEVARLLEND